MSGMAVKHYQSIDVDTKSSRTINDGLQFEGLKWSYSATCRLAAEDLSTSKV